MHFLTHRTIIELGAGVLVEVGEKEGNKVTVKSGRFGPYINWKKVNAKLPVEYMEDPSELSLDEAWSLIEEKAKNAPVKSSAKGKKSTSNIELPPAPKRPLSAYLHFCAEKRPEVSSGAKTLGSISQELARLWAETSEEDRKPFAELAESGKAEYEEKKKKWNAECQKLLKEEGSSKLTKAPKSNGVIKTKGNPPKRPLSAYMFFCSDKRPEVSKETKTLGEVSKELARRWSLTSPTERKPYEELASKDKARYESEKLKAVSGSKSSPKNQKKKRGPSAYMLFCAEHRPSIVDENGNKLPLGETTKRLAKMWKECTDDTRAKFMAEAEKQKGLLQDSH